MKIDNILKDLYNLDPQLQAREKELKKVIDELISHKPEAMLNKKFKDKLRTDLLEQFPEKISNKESIFQIAGRFILRNRLKLAFGGAIVSLILVGLSFYRNHFYRQKIMQRAERENITIKPGGMTLSKGKAADKGQGTDYYRFYERKEILPSQLKKDNPDTPYDESKYKEVIARSAKEVDEKFMGLGFVPEGAPGVNPNYPPGYNEASDKYGTYKKRENVSYIKNYVKVEAGNVLFDSDNSTHPGYYHNTEDYDRIYENDFQETIKEPLSTFSIDVDTASYANTRRFINSGRLPYRDAVRIEEFINYFNYEYPQPEGEHPFAFHNEISECPWNPKHRLLHIGIQGKKVSIENLPPGNLVFLLDVSGSMNQPNKLPLLKSAFRLLTSELRQQDRVAIVVYAGASGLVLPSTPGNEKKKILDAIDKLRAGGSTAGAAGIKLAYKTAEKYFNPEGNNRVIIATDGDFNVGVSSDAELVRLIEKEREKGIFLTVLGFGSGNYKDSKMEKLADKGNGNYAYIDSFMEARKVLVNEMGGTLLVIAKDVKIQIEFNPARVKSYRLVGYENRVMVAKDFDDDTKDAGELGAGHTVTALYEIVPAEGKNKGQELEYQSVKIKEKAFKSDEIMTIKFRYKKSDENKSRLIKIPVKDKNIPLKKTSDNFRFSAAVAEWGLLLRDSKYKGKASYKQVLKLARGSKGEDSEGYRAEFIRLVKTTEKLSKQK